MTNMQRLTSQNQPVALVTGSSRGIGLAIAERLADAGFSIVLNGKLRSPALEAAEKKLLDLGAKVLTLPFDISDADIHENMLQAVIRHFGRIDCLVNNAGISVNSRGDLLEVSQASFDEQIAVNLRSHFFLTQRIARWMTENPGTSYRSIVTISSSNAEAASINRGEYCIAKSALSMMNKLFAVRLAGENIHVFEVRPGLIATDMTKPVRESYENRLASGFSPINRWGHPTDVASVVEVLATGKLPFATGEAIHVDGGLLVARY